MILHRTKRTIYVVLLCVALLASGFSIYNQFASDNTSSQLADQVAKACGDNRALALAQGLDCQQAKEVQQSGPAIIKGDKGDLGPTGYTGEQGDKGDTGAQGPMGVTGPEGPQGATGDVGLKGDTGDKGSTGETGAKGDTGDKGADGATGNDGAPPAAWTWTDPVSQVTFTCTRSNVDDRAPTYNCEG